MTPTSMGALHHIELWVPSFPGAEDEWSWLLSQLGYETYQEWPNGRSWRLGPTYIVLEESPDLSSRVHERTSPGLNHLAFHAGTEAQVDAIARESRANGWTTLFQDKYPHAGGPGHYAAYIANSHGFEVELVATD
jgi:catechol 2,3-dioxygenase-like lactoylglutathione lyase family enzyme